MKKTFIMFTFIISLIILTVGCGKKETPPKDILVVGMELAYPPFETKDNEGNPSGISPDFAKAFGEYVGKEIKLENIAWEGLIPSLQTGKIDMIISSMSTTPQRAEAVDFSVPYANSLLAILVNKETQAKSIADLDVKGKKIAVKTGTSGFIYASKNIKNAKVLAFADESAAVTEVVQGKIDGFFYDQLSIYRNWEKNKETTHTVFVPFQSEDLWCVAVKKGNKELLNELNEFIPKFINDGGFDILTEKYLAKEKEKFDELGFKWFFESKK